MLPKFKVMYEAVKAKYKASIPDTKIGQIVTIVGEISPEVMKDEPKLRTGYRGEIIENVGEKDGVTWYKLKFADGKTVDVPANVLEFSGITAPAMTTNGHFGDKNNRK